MSAASLLEPFSMYQRSWVDYDLSSSSSSDLETDAESGISICSSSASSISGSCEDFLSMRAGRCSRKFTIATYNILTDNCIREGEYLYCPPENRYMENRHHLIMVEIKTMSPDIVCFQEVDYDHYHKRLSSSMKLMGYTGVQYDRLDDQGLAVFWKDSVFELRQQKCCLLQHLAETYLQMAELSREEREIIRAAIQRPEGVLLVRLQHVTTGSQIAIANLHVLWQQLKYPALQSLQVACAVNELADFSRGYDCCSQVICGDFNSPPDSLGYHLMSRGSVANDFINSLNYGSEDRIERMKAIDLVKILPAAFVLRTPFKSAYKTAMDKEPAVTNCDEAGQDYRCELCLDYIWYCTDSLDVCGVLDTPPPSALTKHVALPSVDFPSDHIPLLAELTFKVLYSGNKNPPEKGLLMKSKDSEN